MREISYISFLIIGLYFLPNWVLQVLLPLECFLPYSFLGYKYIYIYILLYNYIHSLMGQMFAAGKRTPDHCRQVFMAVTRMLAAPMRLENV